MHIPTPTNDFAINIKGLTKSFKDLKVLNGIDLAVKRGTMLALLGPNGAGKTTIVRILSTLLSPDSGKVLVNNYDVVTESHEVRSSIGLTGQYAAVDEFLSGFDNLVLMGRLYHLTKDEAKKRSHKLLEQFDLVDAASRQVKTYSGGMKRRLDLAASLMAEPPVIFLDEPTTGLDPRSRIQMWNVIKKLMESGHTILLTTQYLEEADLLADRIAVLDDGKIIAEGTSDELKQKVGKDRLELVINGDLQKAAQAMQGEVTVPEERKISVAVGGGVKDIKTILDRVEAAGVTIESLSLHKPTLDDVFLELTGHKAKEAREEIK